jgi:ketosteroid isomerase-like protein
VGALGSAGFTGAPASSLRRVAGVLGLCHDPGVDREQFVRATWATVAAGEFDALAAVLTPDARWRAVEDGPWNCENRSQIISVMRENRARGALAGVVEDVREVGDRAIVAFRPEREGEGQWPLDDGVRYVVLSFDGGLVSEMKGCADRASALAYAAADGGS